MLHVCKTDCPSTGLVLRLLVLNRDDQSCITFTQLCKVAILTNYTLVWYEEKTVGSGIRFSIFQQERVSEGA